MTLSNISDMNIKSSDKYFKYDEKYLNELRIDNPDVICDSCNFPFEWPVTCYICHEALCYSCISQHCCSITTESFTKCCNVNGNKIYAKSLSGIQVVCGLNANNGCKWQGTRASYTDHLSDCSNFFSDCPLCGQRISSDLHFINNECTSYNSWISSGDNSTSTNYNTNMMIYVKNLLYCNDKINRELLIIRDEIKMIKNKDQVITHGPNHIDLTAICNDSRESKKNYMKYIREHKYDSIGKKLYIQHVSESKIFTTVIKIASIDLCEGFWFMINNINNKCQFIKTCANLGITAALYIGKINTNEDFVIPCGIPFRDGHISLCGYGLNSTPFIRSPFSYVKNKSIVSNKIDLLLYLEMSDDLHLSIANDVTGKYSAINVDNIKIMCTKIANSFE